MPVSVTSARVYVSVPNALNLNQSQLDSIYSGIRSANVTWVRIYVPWAVMQPTPPVTTTIVTRAVATTVSNLLGSTTTTVTTVTTTVGSAAPTVTTSTQVQNGSTRTLLPRTTTRITTTTTSNSTPTLVWTAADLAVNRAFAAGLNVMLVLSPPVPSWLTGKIAPADFAGFAAAVADRYKPGGAGIEASNAGRFVAEFQLWEEPNHSSNWPGGAVSAAEYANVLKLAYPAIKKTHSGAVVVMAGLQACKTTSVPSGRTSVLTAQEPVAYLTAMYTAGVKGYFDVAAYHPLSVATAQFPDPPAPSGNSIRQADQLYAVLRSRDAGKSMYWTAVGYDTAKITPEQQAAYLDTIRWFAEDRKAWVTGLGVFSYRD